MRYSVDSGAVSIYVTTTNSSDNRSLSARGRLIQNERPGSSLLIFWGVTHFYIRDESDRITFLNIGNEFLKLVMRENQSEDKSSGISILDK